MVRFIQYLKKRGVSLVEVLLMVMIAGTCMVPIVGSLDQGIVRVQRFELQTAMQNLAESSMNEIVYKALYEGVTPVGEAKTINYPSDDEPDYQIKVVIEVLNDLTLDGLQLDGSPSTAVHVGNPQHSALSAVSVMVELLGDQDIVGPVTVFTMLCPPPPPPDYVYVAVPGDKKIVVINPMNHSSIDEFSTDPEIPIHLAVHPNGRRLAIKTATKILLMNIDSDPGSREEIWSAGVNIANTTMGETGTGDNNARHSRGLVWRSDGKYLYFVNRAANRLMSFTVPASIDSAWPAPVSLAELPDGQNIGDVKLLEDGALVIASRAADGNSLIVLNTHTHVVSQLHVGGADPGAAFTSQLALAGTWCGNYLYGLFGDNRLVRLRPEAPTDFAFTSVGAGDRHSLIISPENHWVTVARSDGSGAGTERFKTYKLPDDGLMSFAASVKTLNTGPPGLGFKSNTPVFHTTYSPNRNEFIARTTDKRLVFPSFKAVRDTVANGGYGDFNDIMPAYENISHDTSDVHGRIAEYAWVVTSDGTSNHSVECVDIFGGAESSGRLNADKAVDLDDLPSSIALDAAGQFAVVPYNTNSGDRVKRLDCFNSNLEDFPEGLNFPTGVGDPFPRKSVFLLDGSLLVLVHLSSSLVHGTGTVYPDGAFPSNAFNSMNNGFLLYKTDSERRLVSDPIIGFFAHAHDDGYRVRDVVAFHKSNGAYVLMSREDNEDAILVWVEKTAVAGYSGAEGGAPEYKVMGMWRTVHDGFPAKGRPLSLALSPDDKVLAIYDTKGNGSKQVVRFYDLVNQRFPTTSDLAFVRYQIPSYSHPSSPSTPVSNNFHGFPKDAPINPKRQFTRLTTLSMDPDALPAELNNVGSNDHHFYSLFGSWRHEYVHHAMMETTDAQRVAFNHYYPFRNLKSGTREPWTDMSNTDVYSFFLDRGPGATKFQLDAFSNDASLNYKFRSANSGPITTTFSNATEIPANRFRPFQFRPALISELVLDGSGNLPDLNQSNAEDLIITFMRDRAIPALLMLDKVNKELFAYNPFDSMKPMLLIDGADNDFKFSMPPSYDYNDMAVSPDGRRLLIAGKTTVNPIIGKVLSLNIDYGVSDAGIISVTSNAPDAFYSIDLDKPALRIATRPFSSFSSSSGYEKLNNLSATADTFHGYGAHRAAAADGGIYVFGGSAGINSAPISDKVRKINPRSTEATADVIVTDYALLNELLKDVVVMPFEDKILLMGGMPTGDTPKSSVAMFDPKTGAVDISYDPLKTDDNSEELYIYRHAAAATPYGPMIMGGVIGAPATFYEFDSSAGWLANGQGTGSQISEIPPTLQLAAGNNSPGSFFLNNKIDITNNTSFYTSFTTTLQEKDGITFCIQNMAANALPGAGNRELGYKGMSNSLAVWIDTRAGSSNDGPPGNSDSYDAVTVAINGQEPDPSGSYADTDWWHVFDSAANALWSTYHWWIVYDGTNNMLNVWASSGTDPEAAEWVVRNYPANLASLTGGSAWLGFTAGSNDSGYMRVRDWYLKVWEKDSLNNLLDVTLDDFDSTVVSTHFNTRNDAGANSGRLELTPASNSKSGSAWFKVPVDLTTLNTLEIEYVGYMSVSNGFDGITFVVQDNALRLPSTLPGSGGYSGITNSIGIMLDVRDYDTGDPDDNHIGIHKNGDVNDHYRTYSPAWNMSDDKNNWVWIEFDNPANNIRVFISETSTKPTKPVLNHVYSQPLKDIIGSDNVYVGFTARTPSSSQPTIHAISRCKIDISELVAVTGGTTDAVRVYYPDLVTNVLKAADSSLTTVGDATIGGEGVLTLTPNSSDKRGAIWTTDSYSLPAGTPFSSSFIINMSGGADGMTFAVQGIGNNQLSAVLGGSTLGYQGILNSVAVEFDVWDSGLYDGDANHVAIQSNGSVSVNHDKAQPAFLLDNGIDRYVWVDYNGSTLEVRIAETSEKPLGAPLVSHTIAMPANAWFGFTAATGGSYQFHRVLGWELKINDSQVVKFPRTGETLSAAPLPDGPRMNGTAVTHFSRKDKKWYLYYIGGGAAHGDYDDKLVSRYDFDSGSWQSFQLYSTDPAVRKNINFSSSSDQDFLNQRTLVAACSWGDEIFIFGGKRADLNWMASAFNPDTMTYRSIGSLPADPQAPGRISASAVPYGPYIYIIGGAESIDGTNDTRQYIWRYKP